MFVGSLPSSKKSLHWIGIVGTKYDALCAVVFVSVQFCSLISFFINLLVMSSSSTPRAVSYEGRQTRRNPHANDNSQLPSSVVANRRTALALRCLDG